MGQHLEEGDVQEGSTGDSLNMFRDQAQEKVFLCDATQSCFPKNFSDETNLKHPIADFLGQRGRQIGESNAWILN